MTREEIIENLWGEIVRRNIDLSKSNITEIVDFVIKNYKPELPEGLDEAAEEFAHLYDQGTCDGIAQECFKAGAEWMANKGETRICTIGLATEKITATITKDTLDELDVVAGDKVIVQVRKK